MQAVVTIEVQITALREEFLAVTSSASQRPRDDARLDEIILGCF